MIVKVLFTNSALDKNLNAGWGVSFLVGENVIFDTGDDGKRLVDNMKQMKINLHLLEAAVISHDHYDHSGGLREVLKATGNIRVYVCHDFSGHFKRKVKGLKCALPECLTVAKIAKDIYTTGEICGKYQGFGIAEQSLVIKGDKGISVLTGCAHPGIVRILESVKANFFAENIYLVAGGFHMAGKKADLVKAVGERFKKLGVLKVAPTHCSGSETELILKKMYKENFIPLSVGQTLEV